MSLAGRTALVTGAGRGIGKGCALELARAGANVVINDRPGSADISRTAGEIRAMDRDCTTIEADVFSRAGCESLVAEAVRAVARIDILISNPAFGVRCDFLNYDPGDFEKVVAATLTSGFHVSQLVARHLVKRCGGGKIVFISSVQAEMPLARSSAYSAAKAGLNHMARIMAVELAAHRINVNVIEPGWIDTPGEREAFDDDVIRFEETKLPWGRLGSPQDIGRAAVFLASDSADYITGAVLPVDGGFRFKDCRSTGLIPTRE
jgi:glucose 1-dehydrogenase